jgi:stress-induced-phosphoprotein 1
MSAEDLKNQGNDFFTKKKWAEAIKYYSQSVEVDPTFHVSFSNRSQAYYMLGDFQSAKADGLSCVKVSPDFVKGYHRLGSAQLALRDYEGALATCKVAEKRGFRENKDIKALYEKVAPLAEKAKLAAINQLKGAALWKAEGNELFKLSKYEEAIEKYTQAVTATTDTPKNETDKAIAVDCYNNRAVCWMQQQNYRQVIADCSAVLAIEDGNLKALFRRAMAFEGLEKYRSALEDIRACCVKKPDWAAANTAQHRIGNAVRMLKQMDGE